MEIIRGLEELKESYPNTAITIGNFAGLHLGHQIIIQAVLKGSEEINGTSMVVTFDPHPMKVLAPENDTKLLTTPKERERLIQTMGIHVLLCITFNTEFSRLQPDDFIENVLVQKIGARKLIVGQNYAFGKARKDTTELLRRRGREYGISASLSVFEGYNSPPTAEGVGMATTRTVVTTSILVLILDYTITAYLL